MATIVGNDTEAGERRNASANRARDNEASQEFTLALGGNGNACGHETFKEFPKFPLHRIEPILYL
jgi:hypothetical protein